MDGQVYTLKPDTGEWTLFAEGLHTPLGISVVNDQEVVVCQRPEVTKLRDVDADGIADEYEVLSDAFGISGNYHEFNFGPVRDSAGNFYVALGTASAKAQVSGMRSVVYLILSATWTGCMLVSHIGVGFCRFLQMAKLYRMLQVFVLPMALDSTWRATCS